MQVTMIAQSFALSGEPSVAEPPAGSHGLGSAISSLHGTLSLGHDQVVGQSVCLGVQH